ncbi:hypothetical protein ACFY9Q_14680 [Streptomyces sp. NPDC012389]|uniref:hypothetical protein n=1 Tax=unclassified Streptomyces TaxID=2593676 RepID=UPI00081EFB82|nr:MULTISPECIES: hypothetical protein [unclassified Streptomyces]MYR94909.1 hypothetical protein [Streptomyces sp. SID4937]SCD80145.1 hypothetical protein GA0115243_1043117 [Streptomyces sp. ScaeMP-e83]
MSRRAWLLAWAVLCVAGLTATSWLQARPERPVKAECREYIAEIEGRMQAAKSYSEGEGGIVAFSRDRTDCTDELDDLFRGDR